MNFRPLQDRIVVRRTEAQTKTAGGLFIPENAKERPLEGVVISVGNGKILENGTIQPLDIKVGDKVLFAKYAGTELKVDGEDQLILREEDVLGVLE